MSMKSLMAAGMALVNHKPVRYMAVSAVAVVVSQTILGVQLLFEVAPVVANLVAVSIATIPSYVLNRYWVWGKRGRNHFWREVAPFWGMAFLGLVLSTVFVDFVDRRTDWAPLIMGANLSAFGILWVVKYFILNHVMFKVAPPDVKEDIAADEAAHEVPSAFPS